MTTNETHLSDVMVEEGESSDGVGEGEGGQAGRHTHHKHVMRTNVCILNTIPDPLDYYPRTARLCVCGCEKE